MLQRRLGFRSIISMLGAVGVIVSPVFAGSEDLFGVLIINTVTQPQFPTLWLTMSNVGDT